MKAGYPTVQNQAWTSEIGHSYVRMPDRAEAQVRKPLWDLSRNSAGLALYFTTNSPTITVRYKISGAQAMPTCPPRECRESISTASTPSAARISASAAIRSAPKVQYSYSALAPPTLAEPIANTISTCRSTTPSTLWR